MSRPRLLPMLLPVIIPLALCCQRSVASTPSPAAPARVTLEARVVTDSGGCPMAVDLFLVSTTDSIQGLQIALRWDRPDHLCFVPMTAPPPGRDSTSDTSLDTSLASLLALHANSIAVDPTGGLLAGWELVNGRSTDGISATVIAIPALLTRGTGPILPGGSGLLVRLPVTSCTLARLASSDSAMVWFDRRQTHISDPNGRLLAGVTFRDGVASRVCPRRSQP